MDAGNRLYSALLKASGKLKNAPFDSVNPFHKSRYASLSSVIETIRPVLAEAGIVLVQPVHGMMVETRLIHAESGESLTSETAIVCPTDPTPQQYGSALTYARRYGLQSIVSICGEEDDDAEGAEKRGKESAKPLPSRPADDTATAQAKADLAAMVDKGAIKKGSEIPEHAPGPAAIRDEIQQGIEEIGRRTGKTAEEVLLRITSFTDKNGKVHSCRMVSELSDKWAGSTIGKVRKELAGREPGDD